MRRSDMDAALEELYAQVPDVGCKGLCHQSCGPIGMNPREHQRIRERGVKIPHYEDALAELVESGDYTCPALKDNRCTVYDVRPMVCHLWGAVESMPCEYGCRPAEGDLLSDAEGHALLAQSLDVGKPDAMSLEELARFKGRLEDQRFRRTVREYAANTRRVANPEQAVKRWQGKSATPKKRHRKGRRG